MNNTETNTIAKATPTGFYNTKGEELYSHKLFPFAISKNKAFEMSQNMYTQLITNTVENWKREDLLKYYNEFNYAMDVKTF